MNPPQGSRTAVVAGASNGIGAVIGLARSPAAEAGAHGITVNAIAPTRVRTGTTAGTRDPGFFDVVAPLQSMKRASVPEVHAGLVSFPASDDAAFTTGRTLVVDGGWVGSRAQA